MSIKLGLQTLICYLIRVLYFLAKHPEEFKKAREEVDRVLGRRSPNEQVSISADKIHELEYCKAILFETMRLRTPVVGVDRYPTRDTVIDGVEVPAGESSAIGKFTVSKLENYGTITKWSLNSICKCRYWIFQYSQKSAVLAPAGEIYPRTICDRQCPSRPKTTSICVHSIQCR